MYKIMEEIWMWLWQADNDKKKVILGGGWVVYPSQPHHVWSFFPFLFLSSSIASYIITQIGPN